MELNNNQVLKQINKFTKTVFMENNLNHSFVKLNIYGKIIQIFKLFNYVVSGRVVGNKK